MKFECSEVRFVLMGRFWVLIRTYMRGKLEIFKIPQKYDMLHVCDTIQLFKQQQEKQILRKYHIQLFKQQQKNHIL